jgi:hypothetical protein
MTNFETIVTSPGWRWSQQADADYGPDARTELFWRSNCSADTEFEFLGLLHYLVRSLKPQRCIETGTASGLGAVAIASALAMNGTGGKLVTVDIGRCDNARSTVEKSGLSEFVEFIQSDSMRHCASVAEGYDFGFFDSAIEIRALEIKMLRDRGKLSGLCAVHDTGLTRHRSGLNHDLRSDLKALNCLELPLGRGLSLLRV